LAPCGHTSFVGVAGIFVGSDVTFPAIKKRVESVLKGRAPLSVLTDEERTVAARFYRDVANKTTGKFAVEARLYNYERARYLEQDGLPVPFTLPDFIKSLSNQDQ
jgi:hypothetical protein